MMGLFDKSFRNENVSFSHVNVSFGDANDTFRK